MKHIKREQFLLFCWPATASKGRYHPTLKVKVEEYQPETAKIHLSLP